MRSNQIATFEPNPSQIPESRPERLDEPSPTFTVTVTVTVMLMLMLLMLSVCCQARVRREHPRPFGLVAFGGPFGLVTLGDGAIRYPGGDRQLVVSDTALSAVSLLVSSSSPNFKDATLSKKSSISSIASNSWTS